VLQAAQEAAEVAGTPSFAVDEVPSLTAPMDFMITPSDDIDPFPFSDPSAPSNEPSTDTMGLQAYYSLSQNAGAAAYGVPTSFTFGGGESGQNESQFTPIDYGSTGSLHFDGLGGEAESASETGTGWINWGNLAFQSGAEVPTAEYPASQSAARTSSTPYTFPPTNLTRMPDDLRAFDALRARSAEPSLFSHLADTTATRPLPRRKTSLSPAAAPFEFGREGPYRLNGVFGPSSLSNRAMSTASTPGAHTASTPTAPAATGTPRVPAPLTRRQPSLTTPNRQSSTPVRSSPLAGPPLHAVARETTPPASLPPRLRPSPERRGSSATPGATTPPSPPVFPQSRPMANQPKAPKLAASPATVAKRMEKARIAKKASTSKVKAKTVAAGGKAAVAKKKAAGAGAKNTPGSAGERVEEVAEAEAETPPVLNYSITNNNGRRLREEAAADMQKKAAAATQKAENMRLHNPDGDTPLFVTRGRRHIQAPTNRGDVLTLKQRNELIAEKARLADEKLQNEFKKRKAATEVNRAPTKR
jgi:hypothetical protein